jgi:tellurite resistance protein TerC
MWIVAALLFAGLIHHALNRQAATEYLAGYGIEEALSIDNLFVFLVLFRALHLDTHQQRRIFFWGLAGAFILRACAIAAGVSLFQKFFWVQICTGGFLIVTAVHTLTARRQPQQSSWMGGLAQRLGLQVASRQDGQSQRSWKSKGFLLALLLVQVADLLFAMDSIPAVLAVTHNFFIVYASNIFAVAGMRALYFVIADFLERLSLLHYGLGSILLLAGAKLLLAPICTISATASLAALGFILAVTAGASLLHKPSSKDSVRR